MKLRSIVAAAALLLLAAPTSALPVPAQTPSATTVPSSGGYTGQNQNLPQNLPPPVINNDPLPTLPTTTKPVVTTKAPASTTTIASAMSATMAPPDLGPQEGDSCDAKFAPIPDGFKCVKGELVAKTQAELQADIDGSVSAKPETKAMKAKRLKEEAAAAKAAAAAEKKAQTARKMGSPGTGETAAEEKARLAREKRANAAPATSKTKTKAQIQAEINASVGASNSVPRSTTPPTTAPYKIDPKCEAALQSSTQKVAYFNEVGTILRQETARAASLNAELRTLRATTPKSTADAMNIRALISSDEDALSEATRNITKAVILRQQIKDSVNQELDQANRGGCTLTITWTQ